jgi:uncharacterized delta-60 repeat protein
MLFPIGVTTVIVTAKDAADNEGTDTFGITVAPANVTMSAANLLMTTTTLILTGSNFSTTPGNSTVAFTPTGTGTVTAASANSLTVTSLTGLTPGALYAVVTTNGLSSGAAVQVATVVAPGPGDLDPLNLNIVGSGWVAATVVQPDGKTIIAGSFTSVLGVARNNIARLNADGTLDTGFNPIANGGVVYSVAMQADGQILLGGTFTTVGGTTRNYIARVAANGTLDAGFDPNADGQVHSVAVQADGQILLGGFFTTVGGTARNRIARVAANGTLDAGFNPNANHIVLSVAVQADGQILLGGTFTTVGGTACNYIARVAASGTLDAGFNPNVLGGGNVNSVALQADGQILLGGNFSSVGGTTRNRIARVAANGTLDAGFNPNANSEVYSVALQADGQILLGGVFTSVGGTMRNRIARVAADGTLDAGFNPNADNHVWSVAVQADGKVLLGGIFTTVGGTGRNLFARLLNDPATQSLTIPSASRVQWLRGGASPEVEPVTFELSTDGGTIYSALGAGTRISGGWERTGLTLPASGHIRARGRTTNGYFNGSGGLVETVASFSLAVAPTFTNVTPASGSTSGGTSVTITGTNLTGATSVTFGGTAATGMTVLNATTITATTPAGTEGAKSVVVTTLGGSNSVNSLYTYVAPPTVTLSTANLLSTATTLTLTGTNFSSTSGNNTITFTPSGTGTVASANSSSLTVTGLSGLTPGALNAVVTTNGLSSGDPVQVGTVLAPVLGDPDSLNANISEGTGHKVTATAVQPDGKTIIAGFFTSVGGIPRSFIARLNTDGSLDAGFDPNAGGAVGSSVHSVVVQADGKILLAGPFSTVGGIARNYIARVHADGTLDSSFAPNVHRDTGPSVESVAVQANGQILFGGSFTTVNGIPRSNIARMHSDGTLDASFNPDVGADGVLSMAVQEDGRILLGGAFHAVGGTAREFLARVNADGTLDTSFNSPNPAGVVHSVAVQADGRILFGGSFYTVGGIPCINIARVSADGTLDTSFNPNASGGPVSSMVVQADGKILLGGAFHTVGVTPRNFLARVGADGTLDMGFDPSPRPATVQSVAVQADGKILIGGQFTYLQPNGGALMTARNLFARLLNDPATQTLSVVDATQVNWTRGGSSPEVSQVTFEQSTNGSSTCNALGNGIRIGSTANWQLNGLSLPASGQLRARGRTTGGLYNGSSGLVEAVASFSFSPTQAATNAMTTAGLTGANAALDATPHHDGVENLLKYAFNMNLSGPDSATMPTGGGSGLPGITAQPNGAASIFRFEFLQRKNSGLSYTPQKSGGLGTTWSTLTAPPTVVQFDPIDANWERVIYEEPYNATTTPRWFGRVQVSLP